MSDGDETQIASSDSKKRKLHMDKKKMEWGWNNNTNRITGRKGVFS